MVDPHTHLDMPFGGTTTIDDVESGQIAAAFGGTTCHVDFIIQPPGSSFADAFDEWRSKANGKQVIDMGYHMAVTDLREGGSLEELASLPDQGITSYKLFMAYKGALMVDDERSSAPSISSRVVLPDPDGPITRSTSPAARSRSTARTASTAVSPAPYVFVSPRTVSTPGLVDSPGGLLSPDDGSTGSGTGAVPGVVWALVFIVSPGRRLPRRARQCGAAATGRR
jgi:hypothetical protein